MTEGFSGYLCEILILHYGGFTPLLHAASNWRPHQFIDPEKHVAKKFDEPLIVIDPVDPKRNVAAAVSLDRMVEFVELARGYLDDPSEDFFRLREPRSITKSELATLLDVRGTSLYAVTFGTPPFIEEVIVPQLKRSVIAIREHLERNGFVVHQAHYDMKPDRSILLIELLVGSLPNIKLHPGPPIWNRENAEKFREKYVSAGSSGPFIAEGRYEVEIPREFTRAKDLLMSQSLLSISLGKHVRQSLETGWNVADGADCWEPEFSPFIAGFFSRSSPLVSIRRKSNE
jgi:tRNA nucleotidyltransferase (CCA-adding enzyme)